MKITALVENTSSSPAYAVEHGLSLYIETASHKILFDMGQSDLFAENARKLGIDLSQADIAILSHGHYDHGGGLGKFLELNQKAPVYISPFAFEPHYNGTEKYIGLDPGLRDHPRLIFTAEHTVIDQELQLYSCNHLTCRYPSASAGLNMIQNGAYVPDDFRHEQYLLIEENDKRILISGCSHKGILNIADWFQPDVPVGGFHFSKLPLDDTLAAYARQLDSLPTEYYTCHCTGTEQFVFMKQSMKQLHYLSTGQYIHLAQTTDN